MLAAMGVTTAFVSQKRQPPMLRGSWRVGHCC